MGYHEKKYFVNYWSSNSKRGRERGRKLIKEITAENFSNLDRDLDIQVYGSHRSPNKLSFKKFSSRHYTKTVKI